jgi:hypothetical protein
MVDKRTRSRRKTTLGAARSPAGHGSLRLFVMLAILVVVNLYVFLWRDGTSLPQVRQSADEAGVKV